MHVYCTICAKKRAGVKACKAGTISAGEERRLHAHCTICAKRRASVKAKTKAGTISTGEEGRVHVHCTNNKMNHN